MTRKKIASPTLKVHLSEERYDKATQSYSGGCLIADSIKDAYPHLSHISVDMATIRVTDRKTGYRYIYLTPSQAQHVLLSFDQGWPNPLEDLIIQRAVVISPIIRTATQVTERDKNREERIEELEAKLEAKGKLTKYEQASLTRLKNPKPAPVRPSSRGRKIVHASSHNISVEGGDRPVQGEPHPNLLRSRNRHFGAKLADPGDVFNNAVQAEVKNRLENRRKLVRIGQSDNG